MMISAANIEIRSRFSAAALAAIVFPMIALGDNITSGNMPMGERISKDPFGFRNLLGQRLDQVISTLKLDTRLTWNSLPPAEEYDDKEVRYGTWSIHDYVRSWSFLSNDACISPKSMLVLTFNHGYLFRVEFRFLSTKTFGGEPPCEDHTPIFDALAPQMGEGVEKRDAGGGREIMRVDGDVIERLVSDRGSLSLIWSVRGSPEKSP